MLIEQPPGIYSYDSEILKPAARSMRRGESGAFLARSFTACSEVAPMGGIWFRPRASNLFHGSASARIHACASTAAAPSPCHAKCCWPVPPPPARGRPLIAHANFEYQTQGMHALPYTHRRLLQPKQLQQQLPWQLPKQQGISKKPRYTTRRQRRKSYLKKQRRRAALKQLRSPVCPPAPFNSNEYLMARFEQQHQAAQQASQKAGLLLTVQAAGYGTEQHTAHTQQQDSESPALSGSMWESTSLVCPPAPLLDNEYYMSRFEHDLAQRASVVPVLPAAEEGIAEWDPLLQETTTFKDSDDQLQPPTSLAYDNSDDDDTCSQTGTLA